jgi:hypothetical protein
MGFTKSHEIYAGIHESGINDALKAFYNARGHIFNRGSPYFVGPDTSQQDQLPPVMIGPFPLHWHARLSLPQIDLHPKTAPLSTLPLAPGQFGAEATLTVDAMFITPPAVQFQLQLFLTGHLLQLSGPPAIGFAIDQLQTQPAIPPVLLPLFQFVVIPLINGAVSGFVIPISALSFGPIHYTAGPDIHTDGTHLYGAF